MKQASIFIVTLFVLAQQVSGQINDTTIIKNFYKALYDGRISPDTVVTAYVYIEGESQYVNAVGSVLASRDPVDGEDSFFGQLKKEISLNHYSLEHYSTLGESEKIKFSNLRPSLLNGIYKVILKNIAIPSYILIDKGKVMSFLGFQKAGSEQYYFIVYH